MRLHQVGLALGIGVLWRAFGWPFPLDTLARVVLVGGAVVAVGQVLPPLLNLIVVLL